MLLRGWVSQMAIALPTGIPTLNLLPSIARKGGLAINSDPESFCTNLGAVERECTSHRLETTSWLPEHTVGKRFRCCAGVIEA